jgi:hypothetical protein
MTIKEPSYHSALTATKSALQRLAKYELPSALDRRLLDLSERQSTLTIEERAEWLDWVNFTQERLIEKFEATIALKRLREIFPETHVLT